MEEPRWITEPMLLAIHAQQVERYGGAHGVRDRNAAFSALGRAIHRWTYDPSADLADLAAAYLAGLARSRGFNDGNKRTGLACALVFLAVNGATLHAPPPGLYAVTMAAASGRVDDAGVAAFIREQMGRGS